MIPIILCPLNEENTIKKIGGSTEIKRHLENLGIVVGGNVTLISQVNENVIIKVKETRIAVGKELAQKIMV